VSALSTTTKSKVGLKGAKAVAKRPRLLTASTRAVKPAAKIGLNASKPVVKRRMRQRGEQVLEATRTLGEVLTVYGPQAAYELGLAEPPKPKRTAPRVAAGMVIGAGAMYFLEPEQGRKHRQKVIELVG
jgi:hypothetical protein